MTAEDMDTLIALVTRRLGTKWTDVVEWLREQNQLDDIEARLRAGDYDGAIQGVSEAATTFATEIHAGYVTGATREASWLDTQLPDALVRYDQTNRRAAAWAEANQHTAIVGLQAEQRTVVQRVIGEGVRAGDNPLVIARDLRDSIGLTPSQQEKVATYRNALETGDLRNALGRELRDGRYDTALTTAIRDERALPADRIDAMVERYRANWVTYRAETISRYSALQAAHQGADEALHQAVDNGSVTADRLEGTWNHRNRTKHPRATHRAMDGQKRKFGEKFQSGSGAQLAYPCDPDAPIEDTAGCTCIVTTRLVS